MKNILRALLWFWDNVVPDRLTVVAFAGFAALIFGIWQIHRPSAWIVGGLALIVFCVLKEFANKRENLR